MDRRTTEYKIMNKINGWGQFIAYPSTDDEDYGMTFKIFHRIRDGLLMKVEVDKVNTTYHVCFSTKPGEVFKTRNMSEMVRQIHAVAKVAIADSRAVESERVRQQPIGG